MLEQVKPGRARIAAKQWISGVLLIVVIAAYAITTAACTPVRAESAASPVYGVTIPDGFRDWQVISVSQEAGNLNELRVILGNPAAMAAFRSGKLPFPDGAIIAKVAWKRTPSVVDNRALGSFQAFVPGAASTRQFMVKDSRRYASSGGWGYGRFLNGKPVDEAQHRTCFACHASFVSGHDFVFTRYAP
jgi:hypothetical protein